jgi:hypothetical protein
MGARLGTGGAMKKVALLVVLAVAACPAASMAKEPKGDAKPTWSLFGEASGKYVDVTGSNTKFLEDYNLQDGMDGRFTAGRDFSDNRSLNIDMLGQSGEGQGYFLGNYRQLGRYSLLLDTSASQQYYNARTGTAPDTAMGVPLAGNFFPFTNDSRVFFGDDDPSTHRIDSGGTVDYQPHLFFSDAYLNFDYESVFGQETLLKGGTVDDPTANVGGTGGPGTVAFDFPGRKKVDYQTEKGFVGGRSPAAGLNWQTDGSYEHSGVKANVYEVNFGQNVAGTELDQYRENSTDQVGKYDLVAGRNLRPNVYVYGGYLMEYEQSSPDPSQVVTPSEANPANSIATRFVTGGDVHRFGNTFSAGGMWWPFSTVLVSLDNRTRGSMQSGNTTEQRNEQQFLTGNIGSVLNDASRNWVDTATQVAANWAVGHGLFLRGHARYRYRNAWIDSTRTFNFVQVRQPEVQDYSDGYNIVDAGMSARWSAGHGRVVELGYNFFHENVDVSVNQVSNEYIQNDYNRRRNNPYVRATASLTDKLRGELRFEFIREQRNLDAPIIDPVQFTMPGGGETDWQSYRVVPGLTYLPDPKWSLYGMVSVGEDRMSINNIGTLPASYGTFSPFEYAALTETVTSGVGYTPTEKLTLGTSYTFVHSSESVGNEISRVEITARYRVYKNWDVRAGYRYLRFDQANFNVDDYRTNIPFLGVSGTF